MIKEEILDSNYVPKMHWKHFNRGRVLNAMDEYATEEAIQFYNWAKHKSNTSLMSAIQLYHIYLQSKTKQWVKNHKHLM